MLAVRASTTDKGTVLDRSFPCVAFITDPPDFFMRSAGYIRRGESINSCPLGNQFRSFFSQGAAFHRGRSSILDEIEGILKSHDISLPDKTLLKHFEYDSKKALVPGKPEPGWGGFENTEYLSIVLNNKNNVC